MPPVPSPYKDNIGQHFLESIGVLLKKAAVVILDEPTAALDPVAEYDIYRQFDTLVGQRTAICISHRLSSCRFCDRISVFSADCIREYETHEEIMVSAPFRPQA